MINLCCGIHGFPVAFLLERRHQRLPLKARPKIVTTDPRAGPELGDMWVTADSIVSKLSLGEERSTVDQVKTPGDETIGFAAESSSTTTVPCPKVQSGT